MNNTVICNNCLEITGDLHMVENQQYCEDCIDNCGFWCRGCFEFCMIPHQDLQGRYCRQCGEEELAKFYDRCTVQAKIDSEMEERR